MKVRVYYRVVLNGTLDIDADCIEQAAQIIRDDTTNAELVDGADLCEAVDVEVIDAEELGHFCFECGEPLIDDPDGSPGVLVHEDREVDNDHPPRPE